METIEQEKELTKTEVINNAIKAYKPLINTICNRYARLSPSIDKRDLQQEAYLGILETYDKLDWSRQLITKARMTTIITTRLGGYLARMYREEFVVVVDNKDGAPVKRMSYREFQKKRKTFSGGVSYEILNRLTFVTPDYDNGDDDESKKARNIPMVA